VDLDYKTIGLKHLRTGEFQEALRKGKI
jgi:hypothetical protein